MEVIFCRFMSTVHAWECSAPHFSGILANTATKMKKNFASCYGNWKSLLGPAIKVVPPLAYQMVITSSTIASTTREKKKKENKNSHFILIGNWPQEIDVCRGQWFFSISLIRPHRNIDITMCVFDQYYHNELKYGKKSILARQCTVCLKG